MILINLDTNPLLFDIKAMTLEFSKKTCLKILLLSQTMKFMLFHIHEITVKYSWIFIKIGYEVTHLQNNEIFLFPGS